MANEFQKMQKLAGLITENLDDDSIERMEGPANKHYLSALKSSLQALVSEWVQEGEFDEDDVIKYLTHLVRNSY